MDCFPLKLFYSSLIIKDIVLIKVLDMRSQIPTWGRERERAFLPTREKSDEQQDPGSPSTLSIPDFIFLLLKNKNQNQSNKSPDHPRPCPSLINLLQNLTFLNCAFSNEPSNCLLEQQDPRSPSTLYIADSFCSSSKFELLKAALISVQSGLWLL